MTAQTDSMKLAYQEFLKANPSFESTRVLDDLRAEDYGRLDHLGKPSSQSRRERSS